MENALNLYYKVFSERGRDSIDVIFITVYCYNGSILLLVTVVNLLQCLTVDYTLSQVYI